METSFALTGKGYVIVAADTTAARSIVKMKIDEDKIKELGSHMLMAYSGEPGQSQSRWPHKYHQAHPRPMYLRRYHSVCGICRAKHPFVPNPQCVSSSPACSRVLDTPFPGGKSAITQSIFRQPAPRWI